MQDINDTKENLRLPEIKNLNVSRIDTRNKKDSTFIST